MQGFRSLISAVTTPPKAPAIVDFCNRARVKKCPPQKEVDLVYLLSGDFFFPMADCFAGRLPAFWASASVMNSPLLVFP